MRGKSESINKPLSAALLDGVGQRRRRYVETGYHTPPPPPPRFWAVPSEA